MSNSVSVRFHNINDWYQYLRQHPLAYASADFIGTMVLIFALFIIAVRPTTLEIISLQNKITELTAYNNSLENKIRVLEKLTLQYQELTPNLPLIDKAVPSKPNVSLYTRQLIYLFNKNQISYNNISFSDYPLITAPAPTNAKQLQYSATEESFNLAITAGYENMKSFISDMGQQLRITSLDHVSITKQKGDTVSVTLKAKIYYLK